MPTRLQTILETISLIVEGSNVPDPSRFVKGDPAPTDMPPMVDPKMVRDPLHRRRMGQNRGGQFTTTGEGRRKTSVPKSPSWTSSKFLLWPAETMYKFLGIGSTNKPEKLGPGLVHKKKGTTQAFTQMGEALESPSIEELENRVEREYNTRGRADQKTLDMLKAAKIAAGLIPPEPKRKPVSRRKYGK